MDKKISQLPNAVAVTADDLIVIVNDPGGTPETQQATAGQMFAYTLQIYSGAAPPAAPTQTNKPALWYPSDGLGPIKVWVIASGTWV